MKRLMFACGHFKVISRERPPRLGATYLCNVCVMDRQVVAVDAVGFVGRSKPYDDGPQSVNA